MSEVAVRQLYLDVDKSASERRGQFVERGVLEAFNTGLADAKRITPPHDILVAIPEAREQIRLGDLFVRLGQLMIAMSGHTATPQRMVTQLYTDVGKLAKKSPAQFAEPAMLAVFNANLAYAKKTFPDKLELQSIPVAIGQVRLGELCTRTGQLMAASVD